jgi:hypothetical protein
MARTASVQSTAGKNVLRRRQTPTSRLRRKRTAARIKLPEGGHEAVLRSEPHRAMIEKWTELAILYERLVMETYGVGKYPVAEIVPIVAFASVARVAYSTRWSSDNPASGSRVSKSSGTAPSMRGRPSVPPSRKRCQFAKGDQAPTLGGGLDPPPFNLCREMTMRRYVN